MVDTELLPCPFCGVDEFEFISNDDASDTISALHFGDCVIGGVCLGSFVGVQHFAEWWNTRDSGSDPSGEDKRSLAECEASQSGGSASERIAQPIPGGSNGS